MHAEPVPLESLAPLGSDQKGDVSSGFNEASAEAPERVLAQAGAPVPHSQLGTGRHLPAISTRRNGARVRRSGAESDDAT